MIDAAVTELAPIVGIRAACTAVGRPRASRYRFHQMSPALPRPRRTAEAQPQALSAAERKEVLAVLHDQRFVDLAPAVVHAMPLDEGTHLCSVATMYRVLRAAHGSVRERRRHATHPARTKPELVAHAVSGTGR